jgi:hypothetical protein
MMTASEGGLPSGVATIAGGASRPSPVEMPIIKPSVNPHQVVNSDLIQIGKQTFMDTPRALSWWRAGEERRTPLLLM